MPEEHPRLERWDSIVSVRVRGRLGCKMHIGYVV